MSLCQVGHSDRDASAKMSRIPSTIRSEEVSGRLRFHGVEREAKAGRVDASEHHHAPPRRVENKARDRLGR
jgi:hypothetical protein